MDQQFEYADKLGRKWGAMLLFTSVFCMAFGLFVPLALEMYWAAYLPISNNFLGTAYASGHNFWPMTIGRMFSERGHHASATTFVTFQSMGCVAMMMSRYPWYLRNCYIGSKSWLCGMRSILPAISLFALSSIPVVFGPNASERDGLSNFMHSLWTFSLFGSYSFIEAYTLICGDCAVFKPWEKLCRAIPLGVCVTSCCLFHTAVFILAIAESTNFPCCVDEYAVPTHKEILRYFDLRLGADHANYVVLDMLAGRYVLKNTAHGAALVVKHVAFWSEVSAVLCLACSHLIMFYFCEERSLQLPQRFNDHRTFRFAPPQCVTDTDG